MTNETEDLYIDQETFPVGTTILTNSSEYPHEIVEYKCLQWSKKGRCKIYDVINCKTFWTHVDPYYIILEVLPTTRKYDAYLNGFRFETFQTPVAVVEYTEDADGKRYNKDGERLYSLDDFNPLYNIAHLGKK